MKNHFVIHIDQPVYGKAEESYRRQETNLLSYFRLDLRDLPDRVLTSFIPPIFSDNSKKVYVDLFGPLLALISLSFLLQYGHSNKHPSVALEVSPTYVLFYYSLLVPILCYFLVKLGSSNLTFTDILALLGYGLYGHVITIVISLMLGSESSHVLFFMMMSLFGGLSGLRIVIVLLMTIPRPGARLLVCSLVSILHLLFLIFIYFAYMHRTFAYGAELHLDY